MRRRGPIRTIGARCAVIAQVADEQQEIASCSTVCGQVRCSAGVAPAESQPDWRALAECDRLVAVLSGSSMASARLRCLPPRSKAWREPHQVGCFARFWCLRALLSPDFYRTGANGGRSRCGQASFSFLSSQVGTSLPPSPSQVCSRWASLTSPDKIADCAIKKSVCLTCPDSVK
jgi:hypothetical protein